MAHGDAYSNPGAGYTITEVMIVLAVTSAMFAAVAIAFSGRQARVEFTQAVRNFEANLQTIISDVSTGYYHSTGFRCTVDASGVPSISAGATDGTGTNSGCMFVGKILNPSSDSASSVIHTVVGRRSAGNSINVSSYTEANPVIVTGVDSTYNHSFQLNAYRIVPLDGGNEVYALGFMKPLSSLDASTGNRVLELYGATGDTFASGNGQIDLDVLQKLSNGALICLRGQNGQRAEISVGEGGGQTTVFSTLDTKPGTGDKCYEA